LAGSTDDQKVIVPEMSIIRGNKTLPKSSREPDSGERDVIVRMFLRSYALMEVLYKNASYYQLHSYASYGPFFKLGFAGFVLSSVVVMLLVDVSPPITQYWARSFWTWTLIGLGLVWAVDKLVDSRIAHIPKGERPAGIEEFHTRRERLKLIGEFVALVPLTYVGQQCMSRIFS